ncbi:ABC transporter ATP-binding protein [Paradesertivirga mongoliensis]|uniref:ABC transporter ATP-binding protein n=1 Tax=Paradesertivirga mongoliensis TaxID=2100740 RepID=A0ABW4ZI75_9SPHI|nr:ABC transporter ATP-binding protein [Pedobacter mongoliensis]
MKTYFRLLSFAKPIEKFAIPYIITTLLFVLFNTLNFALLAPLLQALLSPATAVANAISKPDSWDIMDNFEYYVNIITAKYGRWNALKAVCAVLLIANFFSNVFRYFSQKIMEDLRAHTLLNLRNAIFYNIMDLHLGYFSNERKGDIISKVSSDVGVVQFSVTSTLQIVFKEPVTLIVYLVLLFNISVELTLYSLLIFPISGFVIARIVKRLKNQAARSHQSLGLMIGFLDEALAGIKIVKAFNATQFIKNKFSAENRNYTRLTKSMAKRQQLASPVSEFLGVTMVAGIVLYGGSLILSGSSSLTAPAFITYIIVFSQVLRPAKAITDSFANIHSGIAAGERVLEVIDTKPALADVPGAVKVDGFSENITFDKVSFSYTEKLILDSLSIRIQKGKTIALVGPSGGGKSTLLDLIPRFIDPQKGTIWFDGQDIKKIDAASLRAQIGFVNQESILFNDTIFNNISFGKPDATQEEVEAAAKIANAHDFILKTENGYQTNIGDRGMKLSGGQKQRINIARAVLKNPPILLLDEATSALDTESEKLVQSALNNLMKNRTSLIVAHRLSTIQNADIILVLESGAIVESGSHAELIRKNGLYKKLVEMQTFQDN